MRIPIEGSAPPFTRDRAEAFRAPHRGDQPVGGYTIAARDQRVREISKRALDLVVASVLSVLLTPVAVSVAVAILIVEGRPLIFWQRRVGLYGDHFWCPKFRSMVRDPSARPGQAPDQRPVVKTREDPRLTTIGRFIRRFSIDELPQLWCVLKGEMSMVGPRPALPEEVACYPPRALRRLGVLPGLTCFWQVGGRSHLSFERQVELDIRYVERQRFGLDLWLLLRTIPAVLSGRGAY